MSPNPNPNWFAKLIEWLSGIRMSITTKSSDAIYNQFRQEFIFLGQVLAALHQRVQDLEATLTDVRTQTRTELRDLGKQVQRAGEDALKALTVASSAQTSIEKSRHDFVRLLIDLVLLLGFALFGIVIIVIAFLLWSHR